MDNTVKIRDIALRLLTRREHSEFDLTRKLEQRGFEKSEIQPIIQQLTRQNLLSNERFTENYIRMRVRLGFGPIKIQQELTHHLLDQSLIKKYLDEYQNQWVELAQASKSKKFGAANPKDYAQYAKQARFLQYRGFTSEQITAILKWS